MRYTKFEIENYKGIQHAEIDLGVSGHAKIFSLVGLNESGKTTALEAIHSFLPDGEVATLVEKERDIDEQLQSAVPRSKIADFTGKTSIKAHIFLERGDRDSIVNFLKDEESLDSEPDSIRDNFTLERYIKYKNGEVISKNFFIDCGLRVRSVNQIEFRKPRNEDERISIAKALVRRMPSIAYIPSFIFGFPEKIWLSSRPTDPINGFYRRLFQDILNTGKRGHKIQKHIVEQVRKEKFKIKWSEFLEIFWESHEKQQIQQVIDYAALTVTDVVLNKWNKLFNEETGGKEIIIDWNVELGKKFDSDANGEVDSNEHDIWVKFLVKDGPARFTIGTRSMGFRWFFSFILFTQFRANRISDGPSDGPSDRPIVFLLDEPASNLHPSAQQKLVESFPEIVGERHMLIYSTHSHYMIEPKWLEQTYIVHDESTLANKKIIDAATVDDSSINVKVTPYRRFAGGYPASSNYFQPVIDRLDVIPSKFDLDKVGVIVEGKSDYYILEYFKWHLKRETPALYPATGASTMGALIAILKGWGLPVRVLLDSDNAGTTAMNQYIKKFSLLPKEVSLLKTIGPHLVQIEDVFSDTDKAELRKIYVGVATEKKVICGLAQEFLAGKKKLPIAGTTLESMRIFLDNLDKFCNKT